jgi:hypothetical protein
LFANDSHCHFVEQDFQTQLNWTDSDYRANREREPENSSEWLGKTNLFQY